MNTKVTTLEAEAQQLIDNVKFSSLIALEITQLQNDTDTAAAMGKDSCVVIDLLKLYEDEALVFIQQCQSKIPVDYYISLKNITSILTAQIQKIDSNTKTSYDQCNGDITCQNNVTTTSVEQLKLLKKEFKSKIDWLYQMALSTGYFNFSLCIVSESADLLLQVKQSRYDIEDCLSK